MTEDERSFEKKKANLIMELMDSNFFDRMYDEFKTMSFDSLDALDAFVDKSLKEHNDQKHQIKLYYDKKIGIDSEEDCEDEEEDS